MSTGRTVVVNTLEEMCDLMCGKPEEDEHEYCLRCGRRLKNSEARKIGYGTMCLKKLKHQTNIKLF